eukprot:GFKZ01005041.1.p2 GENE.GFKZ01005041.1~~GFKZ01005041.1.p2  ORF type:complete len:117 (-),score=6.64 GFKZ01005041.1:545-895(-)
MCLTADSVELGQFDSQPRPAQWPAKHPSAEILSSKTFEGPQRSKANNVRRQVDARQNDDDYSMISRDAQGAFNQFPSQRMLDVSPFTAMSLYRFQHGACPACTIADLARRVCTRHP